MSEQVTNRRLAAGLAILLAVGLSAPAMAQAPEDAGAAGLDGVALTAEEIEQLRNMADLPAGEDSGDVSQLIAQLGLSTGAEEAETDVKISAMRQALVGGAGKLADSLARASGRSKHGRGTGVADAAAHTGCVAGAARMESA